MDETVFSDAADFARDVFAGDSSGHDFYHTMRVHDLAVTICSKEGGDMETVRLAALLHDVGKPACFSLDYDGIGHFYGHAQHSTGLANEILTRLRLDRDSRERILALIRYHDLPIPPEAKPVKRLMNKLGTDAVRQLICLHKADTAGQSPLCAGRIQEYDQVEAVRQALLAQAACFSLKDLAVNGRDLLSLGLTGREIGQALEYCLNAVIDERLPNEKQPLLEELRQRYFPGS